MTNIAGEARAYLSGLVAMIGAVEATDGAGGSIDLGAAIATSVDILRTVERLGRKVMLVGNGGSAAIVSHIQNDLFKMVGLKAIVFTEQPLLTALSNDDGYDTAFRQPVDRWSDAGDVLIAVSSSGESANIVTAVEAARSRGVEVITFSGFKPGNRLRSMGAVNYYVPSPSYGYVEMTHAVVAHCITDLAAAQRTRARG